MLISKLLSTNEAIELWQDFGEAVGLECLHDNYGSYWPRKPLRGELVFAWYDEERLVGWEAIRHDLLEPVMWVLGGVFPEYHNKGYMVEIYTGTIKIGFKLFPDVELVFTSISNKNPRYIKFHDDLVEECEWWSWVGGLNVPEPGYTIFGLEKSKWENQDVEKISQSDIS